ncbi:hypothetical protein J8F10_21290 [Gemmata sp. G18]|uniref:SF3 helicase domain-containing protein n=1 Tax=Gemmata palustris TaxID=2822762 RepID=A0ABS5BVV3_9BACT|nr:hypothetical protein [Gemmata palustris]MBP3957795.1 hypothetical protein [Gemmata palustris]
MANKKKASKAAKVPNTAAQLADQLTAALRTLDTLPLFGARVLVVVRGITPGGNFIVPAENVIQQMIPVLVPPSGSSRVYAYGQTVVLDTTVDGQDSALVPLRSGTKVESVAPAYLANLIICEHESGGVTIQFSFPPKALAVLLNAEPLSRALTRIDLYARRPLFSSDFTLLGPGYHPKYRILIHGPEIEPDLEPLANAAAALDRLLPLLRELLSDFCFREPADLTNYLGLMLTGLLINHFVICLKGVALVDGNQPGVGKTLLMRVLGVVMDGVDPNLIHYTPDEEELQKRTCATLRPGRQTALIYDNAKQPSGTPISSPTIEANSMAPEISLRILGVSENYVRPNDVIWAITMNQTRVSPDLMSRGLPIRLAHDGPPEKRVFTGPDPIEFAREHRLGILAELAGFVVRWNQAGRPEGSRSHRCHRWAKIIGGILEVNEFPDFLANYEEASGTFNAELEDLTLLIEAVLAQPEGPFVVVEPPEDDQ